MKLSEEIEDLIHTANQYMPQMEWDVFLKDAYAVVRKAEQLEAQIPQWISVEDRLPPDERRLIIFTDISGIYVGIYVDNEWVTNAVGEVTHWMPLPKAPEVN